MNSRDEAILEYLRANNRFVTVDQLSDALFCSGATIRRDLSNLEAGGLLRRVRGGAILIEGRTNDDPIDFRESKNVMQKQIIAGMAHAHIRDGMTLFMDSSSTSLALARRLDDFSNLRVITNGIKNANLLSDFHGITVMCAGGTIRPNSKSLVGTSTLDYLSRYNADIAFMSCRGFGVAGGATEASEDECQIKKVFMQNSKSSILLCDSSKKDQEYLCKLAPLTHFTHVLTEKRDLNQWFRKTLAP